MLDLGRFPYINATRIFIDGEKYAMDEDTILYDTDGSTIKAVGGEEIIDPQGGNLEQGDIVKDVKVENGVVTKMTFVKKASDVTAEQELQEAIEDLIEGVELTATVDNTNAEVSASFEYPQTINVTALTNYKIDVLITLGEALPAGTKVDIDYNSSTVATNVDVAGEDKAFLSDLLNQQPVPISTAHQGLTESWDLTIDGNLEPIKTTATVKVIIATDFDDEDTWVVLADGTVNLDFAVDQNALDAAKQAAVTAVFSATTDKYAMKTALEDNAKLLGLDMSVYNTLSGSDKLAVAQYVVDQALTTTNDLDLDIAAIQQAFADGVDIVQ